MSASAYPLPRTEEDSRFTFGMIREVAEVLVARGYPPLDSGADHVRLQQALFDFLYGEAGR